MVDTGASLVILRETDAANVGIPPDAARLHRDRLHRQRPDQGRAAPSSTRIEIGDITVFDVPALVLPDEALAQNLLGVSFLSRLRRYEYADGRMVLEQ